MTADQLLTYQQAFASHYEVAIATGWPESTAEIFAYQRALVAIRPERTER